jgi:hypothetical protein
VIVGAIFDIAFPPRRLKNSFCVGFHSIGSLRRRNNQSEIRHSRMLIAGIEANPKSKTGFRLSPE